MSNKFVVGIDDSEDCVRAAKFAQSMAGGADTSIHIIHVLEWSPYSFLTAQELEERHKRRGEELERANSAIVAPMLQKLEGGGSEITGEVRYGGIAETIAKYCEEISADQVFVARTGDSQLATRLFGSVPSTLVQISNVPVTVVP
jgi:nucleotide-binding universal stress UspA family protein